MNTGLFVLGVAFLLIGLIMYGYNQVINGLNFSPPNNSPDRPYSSAGIIILVAGLLIIVLSAVTPVTKKKIITNREVSEKPKKKVVIREEIT